MRKASELRCTDRATSSSSLCLPGGAGMYQGGFYSEENVRRFRIYVSRISAPAKPSCLTFSHHGSADANSFPRLATWAFVTETHTISVFQSHHCVTDQRLLHILRTRAVQCKLAKPRRKRRRLATMTVARTIQVESGISCPFHLHLLVVQDTVQDTKEQENKPKRGGKHGISYKGCPENECIGTLDAWNKLTNSSLGATHQAW